MSDEAIVTFAPARREGSHVLISMEGSSGDGKTYSAILLMRGLVGPKGKFGLLDTETGRGKIYADLASGYEYGELTPPFTPERYTAAIKAAEAAGLDGLIIDSASHEWEGIGGIGEIAEASELKGLNKWARPKARHKKFMWALLTTRMHIIVCLRAKEKMLQKGNEVVSGGWVPIQEKGFGFEMTVRLFFPGGAKDEDKGKPELRKCPKDLLGAFPDGAQISVDTGARIAEWVHGGVPVDGEAMTLKRDAEEAAEGGEAVLDKFLLGLPKSKKDKLKPFGANLRSIAIQADKDAAEEEAAQTGALPSFGGGDTQAA
jgi:AAA domain